MNRAQLIRVVHRNAGTGTIDETAAAVKATIKAVADALGAEGRFSYPGFGTFNVQRLAARVARNPRTGAPIRIPASKKVSYKPAPAFRNSLPPSSTPIARNVPVRVAWGGRRNPFRRLVSLDGDRYSYAPTVIQVSATRRCVFYCGNTSQDASQVDPAAKVNDHIYASKGIYSRKYRRWVWGKPTIALRPTQGNRAWDSRHVCDPDVVAGQFRYAGTTYTYAMFYLGYSDKTEDGRDIPVNNRNQIGVAFSNDLFGAWVKYHGNPIVRFRPLSHWGVGQASATCIDPAAGRLMLFYTRSGPSGTRMVFREICLGNMSAPGGIDTDRVRGWLETKLPLRGLKDEYGDPMRSLNNGAILYVPAKDCFLLVYDGYPYPGWDSQRYPVTGPSAAID